MENKIVKQNGITYYFNNKNECYDIDIEPWVTVMQFIANDNEYVSYHLCHIMKQFQKITSLIIDREVLDICIANFMFPNVRLVKSNSRRFSSGRYLIRNNVTLLNTFCLEEKDIVDMSGITTIYDYALAGCRTSNIINADKVVWYGNSAFTGSMFMMKPIPDNRMRLIGKIALNTCTNSDTIIVPDDMENVESIYTTQKELANKTLIIHRRETLNALNHDIYLKKLIVKADIDDKMLFSFLQMPNIKTIELDDHNPYCKIIDDIIYSKNGKILYCCLHQKKGACIIENGVEEICSYAFFECANITFVDIPDSVKTIGKYAFYECINLKYVKYSNSVDYIPEYCFSRNINLKGIQCDGIIKDIYEYAFYGCYVLQELFSLQNCKAIYEQAFGDCYELTDLFCPEDITLKERAFPNIVNVHLESIKQLHDILPAIFAPPYNITLMEKEHKGSSVLNIFTNGQHICIPRITSKTMERSIFEFPEQLLNEHDEFRVFQSINETQTKQELILTAYRHKKSHLFEGYLKRTAKTIAKRRVEENDEEGLIEVLNYDWLPRKALEQLLPDIQEAEMNLAIAYVLDKTNNKEDFQSSFRL